MNPLTDRIKMMDLLRIKGRLNPLRMDISNRIEWKLEEWRISNHPVIMNRDHFREFITKMSPSIDRK